MATIKKSTAPARVQPQKKPTTSALAPQEEETAEDDSEDDGVAGTLEPGADEEDVASDGDGTENTEDAADDETEDGDLDSVADDEDPTADDELDPEPAPQRAASTGNPTKAATQQPPAAKTPASAPQKPPAQAGFARRIGAKSTKPVKQATMARPYLDSPRDFGIHIEGHLVRFKKGRTPITNDNPAWKSHALTVAQVLTALKTDTYVADNGAEVVE